MTRTIIINDIEHAAFDWFESPLVTPGREIPAPHARNKELLEKGVHEMRPGEVSFICDQTLRFDTTFALKGDNRKFVVISSGAGRHIAKPY